MTFVLCSYHHEIKKSTKWSPFLSVAFISSYLALELHMFCEKMEQLPCLGLLDDGTVSMTTMHPINFGFASSSLETPPWEVSSRHPNQKPKRSQLTSVEMEQKQDVTQQGGCQVRRRGLQAWCLVIIGFNELYCRSINLLPPFHLY